MPRSGSDGPVMPFLRLWRDALAGERGAAAADALAAAFHAEYGQLCAEHGAEPHRGLRRHLRGNILPQLAAYRVLQRHEGGAAALASARRLHFATLAGVKRQHERAARLPGVFAFYRLLVPWMLRFGHPSAGWDIEWVENSRARIHARVHRCFYQDTLAALGAAELVGVYCAGDDHVFGEARSPRIAWARECTRPGGAPHCDVRYDRPSAGARSSP